MNVPTSRAPFHFKVAPFDLGWAFVAPPLALLVRDAQLLAPERAGDMCVYWATAFACSIFAFVVFRIRDGVASCFSVNDAVDVAKAAVLATLLLLLALFLLARLDGVPRSTPLIQALILAGGLMSARTFARISDKSRNFARRPPDGASEHIVLIGAGQLTASYMAMLAGYLPGQHRAIGILDERSDVIGRKLAGVYVLGTPDRLDSLISEYSVHGIRSIRVLVGGGRDLLSDAALNEVRLVCARWNIALEFIPELMGLRKTGCAAASNQAELPFAELPEAISSYFALKPIVDFGIALLLTIMLSPFFGVAAGLVLFDLGTPLIFWQQRIGMGGRTFLLRKFRTMRPPVDTQGDLIEPIHPISGIGRLIRKTRLDELPQLLKVLTGEMALIGPRPLLPEDQPQNVAVRLMVRPGLTGWAQVNGGKLLTPEEKHYMDEWYIKNASLWLDVRILCATAIVVVLGERRSKQLEQCVQQRQDADFHRLVSQQIGTSEQMRHPKRGLV